MEAATVEKPKAAEQDVSSFAKSLFLGGVTRRFPGLCFGLLEVGYPAFGTALAAPAPELAASIDEVLMSSMAARGGRARLTPEMRDLLRDSQNRVHAMALVHEWLYQAPDLAHVDFATYLRELAAY